jgi:hypothetical protein
MSQRQLEIDLRRRTRERMEQIICDTFSLYEMAGLEDSDAARAMADVLLEETSRFMAASAGTPEVIGAAVALLVRYHRGEASVAEVEKAMGVLSKMKLRGQRP